MQHGGQVGAGTPALLARACTTTRGQPTLAKPQTNHTQNLFGFTKLEKTPEIEYLLYDKYFYPLIKTLIKNTGPLENNWKRLHPCRRKLRNYDPSKPSAFKTATQTSKKTKRNSLNPCCLSTARRSAKVFTTKALIGFHIASV